ncbi:hypothetical protein A9G09_00015 [Gilliamella sp. wkB292]|uniref:glycosyltransferase family 2 protein n=1 Tax=Gilliamella sp. wkB292 TaxID=3120262 RepID=UPI00080E7BF6|nr:glycosyltransferase family 2 protein [Gilliamella apicola]OCG17406.1 hypothetical protein A9G09_00015 [Gilliamella apicola]
MSVVLSIIIPVYNTEKYLSKCLDSVLNQKIENIEIICVNDGSTDNSLDILKKYSQIDNRIKIINKKNGGMSSARNIGIDNAQGKYITFIDSDDFIEPNAYEKLLPYLDIPGVDLVYFATQLVIEDNVNRKQDEKYFEHNHTGLVKLSNDVVSKMDVVAWNKIFKLSIINNYKIRFPLGLWYEDNPFFWSYALVSDSVYFVNEKFYNYLIRNGSIMAQKNQYNTGHKISHELDSLLCFEYLLNFMFRWGLIEKIKPTLVNLFLDKIYETLRRFPKNKRMCVLNKSTEIVKLYNLTSYYPNNHYIKALSERRYQRIGKINKLFLTKRQRLLGFWDCDKYYLVCFLGFKLKLKKRKNIINHIEIL